jgi:hypothetical protein
VSVAFAGFCFSMLDLVVVGCLFEGSMEKVSLEVESMDRSPRSEMYLERWMILFWVCGMEDVEGCQR